MTPEEQLRKKLYQVLAQTGAMSNRYLDEAIRRISTVIAVNYSSINSTNVWMRNAVVKKQIERILKEYAGKVITLTNAQIDAIWEATDLKNDEIVSKKVLTATGVSVTLGKLAKWFNRLLPTDKDPREKVEISVDVVKDLHSWQRNQEALEAFKSRSMGGLNLSERVWKITDDQVLKLIESKLSDGLGEGKSAAQIAGDLKRYLQNPDALFRRVRDPETGKLNLSSAAKKYEPGQGVYRSAYKNAMRLTRSEVNLAYHAADHERWKEMDFIRGINVSKSENHPEVDICDQLAGDYPKDFHFTAWHPQCICKATPILMSDKDFISSISGETVEVKPVEIPDNFSSWIKDNKDRIDGWKSKPYFILNNKKFV